MAIQTFTPPVAPSPGTKFRPQVNLNRAEFGDGYTQTSPRGINHIKETIDFRWEGLTEAQYIQIRQFFEAHGGYQPFWYLPRGRAVPMIWTCREWSGVDGAPWSFTCKLTQYVGAF